MGDESRFARLGCLIPALWSSSSEPFVSTGHTVVCEVVTGGVPEAKLIVSAAQGEVASPDESLIVLLAQAHRWRDQLAAGEFQTARENSRRTGIGPGEVSHIIQLAFLAPDIVEAVLAGRQPVELMPRRLVRIGELPLEWHRQRRLLGFPA